MSNLFDEMYMGFFEETQLELVVKKQQKYYDYLAELVILGEGFLPDNSPHAQPGDFVDRPLTETEKKDFERSIIRWRRTLN